MDCCRPWKLANVLGAAVIAVAVLLPVHAANKTVADDLQLLSEQLSFSQSAPKSMDAGSIVLLKVLATFYENRAYQPLWVSGDGLTARGMQLQAEFVKARGLGLMQYANVTALPGDVVADPATREIEMSWSLLTLGLTITTNLEESMGSSPQALAELERLATDLMLEVEAFGSPAMLIRAWQPSHPAYRGLVQALEEYQAIAKKGGWKPVHSTSRRPLRLADEHPAILAVRHRLRAEGYDVEASSTQFDAALSAQVKLFQSRHGLASDGVLGKGTLAALNVSVDQRIEQIRNSVLRLLALPSNLGERFVWVNIPAFRMSLYEGETEALSMPVIVGKPKHATPEIADTIKTMEVNPYWNVPTSISREEILPEVVANPGYLAKNEMQLLERYSAKPFANSDAVDWAAIQKSGALPFRVRQDPGKKNPLGRVKFLFPNKHAVYMHDTPHRGLFSKQQRAFSHGCVRLGEPMKLARYVLENQVDGSSFNLNRALKSGKNMSVTLNRPLPVYLSYSTAWVDNEYFLNFSNDLYRQESAKPALASRVFNRLEGHWKGLQIALAQPQCASCVALLQ